MNILIVEPFFTGSHQKWAEAYQQFSQHTVKILSLKGRHWKWRMYGGAVTLADQFLAGDFYPDVLIASDMLDLATFVALCRTKLSNTRICMYFHENQITYPWSPDDPDLTLKRNNQYGFINYTSALCADKIFFNSHYHLSSFIDGLDPFLKQFPDHRELNNISQIKQKSEVLYLGLNLKSFDKFYTQCSQKEPVILWNHRWEYDKNPELFFIALNRLKTENIDFKLIILGKSYRTSPAVFKDIQSIFKDEIIHLGYTQNFQQYAELLWKSDLLPVTSKQDFFGGSVVEAIYCHTYPILPSRLAYPEHLPIEKHPQHFYHDDDEFYEKLKNAVLNFKQIREEDTCKNFVARYDWSNLAPVYDYSFENF